MLKQTFIPIIIFIFSSLLMAEQNYSQETVDAMESYQSLVAANGAIEEIESAALEAVDSLKEDLIDAQNDTIKEEIYGEIALLYDVIIVDGLSWLRYDKARLAAIDSAYSLNPNSLKARIAEARAFLFLPEEAGGNIEKGFNLISVIYEGHPQSLLVNIAMGEYYKEIGDIINAKEFYSFVLEKDPNHYKALNDWQDLVTAEGNYTIKSIIFSGDYKTRESILKTLTTPYLESIYDLQTRTEITETLKGFPSITGAQIKLGEPQEGKITLEVSPIEDNLKVYGLFGLGGIESNYNGSLSGNGLPLAMYMDRNLTGRGDQLTIFFAGVFGSLNYIIKERPALPLSLGFSFEVMGIPEEHVLYEHGKVLNGTYKSPSIIMGLSLAKEIPMGFEISLDNTMNFQSFEAEGNNVIAPENQWTYSAELLLSRSPSGESLPSLFYTHYGFTMELMGRLDYQMNYESWGQENSLFKHNEDPAMLTLFRLDYQKKLLQRTSIGGSFSYIGSFNAYERSKWEIGQTSPVEPFPRLSGYYTGEFRTSHGLLLNLNTGMTLIPDYLSFHIKHDVFYHGEEDSIYQGTTVGLAMILPADIEFGIDSSIGWNAERESGYGWSVNLSMIKFFLK